MLCISRKVREEILVKHGDETLRIVIEKTAGNRVQLGFEGPPAFHVVRKEISEKPSTPASTKGPPSNGSKTA